MPPGPPLVHRRSLTILSLCLGPLLSLILSSPAHAAVTVHYQTPLGMTASGASALPTKAAYDGTILTPPAPPQPPSTEFGLELRERAGDVPGLSIPHSGCAFLGFSIEMSVVDQVGKSHAAWSFYRSLIFATQWVSIRTYLKFCGPKRRACE